MTGIDPVAGTTNMYVPAGGVMTTEVGVINGDLWVTTVTSAQGTVVTTGCAGSLDEYTVAGSPVASMPTHEQVIAELTRDRGTDWLGNAMYRELTDREGASGAPT